MAREEGWRRITTATTALELANCPSKYVRPGDWKIQVRQLAKSCEEYTSAGVGKRQIPPKTRASKEKAYQALDDKENGQGEPGIQASNASGRKYAEIHQIHPGQS